MTETVVVERLVTDVVQVSSPSEVVVVDTSTVETVQVGVAGPQGITGPQGPIGPPSFTYVHSQAVSSAVWTIAHNLGGFPNVTVEDSAGSECVGDVAYIDQNTLTITFSAAFGGYAYLS